MIQVFENLQTLLHDGMRFVALDMRHKTHAARVMLVRAGIKPVLFGMFDFGFERHGNFLKRGHKG